VAAKPAPPAKAEARQIESEAKGASEPSAEGGESGNSGDAKSGESAEFADGRRQYPHTVAEMQESVPLDPWYEETVRLMRVRHMAFRTEETYLGWIRRMERFLGNRDGSGIPWRRGLEVGQALHSGIEGR
jgi:hypothetical protein